ncbi:transcription elongation factor S-II [Nematocida displodere]|uniref:Transcription elongation factor S-II n=1 Tax=Nematocida displodere TaxID=1805483 RepID=A0A177EJK7_9MICR|nr:transcription elongation factor S-II [Nematocida displodere]
MNNPEARAKCQGMIRRVFDAMKDTSPEKAEDLSRRIEEGIFSETTSQQEYFELFKAKYLNLKDEGNAWLGAAVYNADIAVDAFVKMTSEEMKSQELKEFEAGILKQSILDSTVQKQEAETEMFFCTNCRQKKCIYRQLQTRSADEPMTTFVSCVSCGNKWKFC